MRVLIVGSGVIGLSTAYFLQRDGYDVTVVDRAPGPGSETSFGNGALLHTSMVEPWNAPGILGRTLRQTLGRQGLEMSIRLRVLPSLLRWGARFVCESSGNRFRRNTLKNLALAQHSLAMMKQIRLDTNLAYGQYFRGAALLYRDAAAALSGRHTAELLESHGIVANWLDREGLLALEPALEPVADGLVGAVHYANDEAGDAHQFCLGLTELLRARGVQFCFDSNIARLDRIGDRITRAYTATRIHEADAYVIAAAADSVALARTVGIRVPVVPVKGYSITVPTATLAGAPAIPIIDHALHVAVVPIGTDRLRVVGAAEFSGFDRSIDSDRIATLVNVLEKNFPRLAKHVDRRDLSPWAGLRPMCADGVPLLGATPKGDTGAKRSIGASVDPSTIDCGDALGAAMEAMITGPL